MSNMTLRRFPSDLYIQPMINFIEMHLDADGYRVYIEEFDSIKVYNTIEIHFKEGYLTQRSLDEGLYLDRDWNIDEKYGPLGRIVLAENSDFLDWFMKKSCGIYDRSEIYHVMILTEFDWIEVLCLKLPSLRYGTPDSFIPADS